jgi:hypothetical protein
MGYSNPVRMAHPLLFGSTGSPPQPARLQASTDKARQLFACTGPENRQRPRFKTSGQKGGERFLSILQIYRT